MEPISLNSAVSQIDVRHRLLGQLGTGLRKKRDLNNVKDAIFNVSVKESKGATAELLAINFDQI